MTVFNIKTGRDLPITGTPEKTVVPLGDPDLLAFCPPNFPKVKFKLEVGVGDVVKVGDPLVSNREFPEMFFTSPGGGIVKEINRGDRRKLLEIIVDRAEEESFKEFPSFSIQEILTQSRESLQQLLLESGLWPYLIQRPFSRIANPTSTPKSIFVRAMDTEPNCADKQLLIEGKDRELQAGINALKQFTQGKLFLCFDAQCEKVSKGITSLSGAEIHGFKGAHPTGNVGTHIHKLDPINKGDVVWHIDVEHLVYIGEFLLTGKIPVARTIALGGSSVKAPQYYQTRLGAPLELLIKGKLQEGETRLISGGVLSGSKDTPNGYVGFYQSTLTAIPEGGQKELAGWLKPGADKPSFSRLFLSALNPGKKFAMDTKVNGEFRAIVATHVYDPLVTLDVHTNFLIKACLVKDVERMEELGLLECAPEDFALATYACYSKINLVSIIKDGLNLLESES